MKFETSGNTALEKWQNKIRHMRQYLRGWAKHTAGAYKKEKQQLISLLDAIDKKAESNSLSDNEIHMKHYLKERLVHLLREEEIKWYERAKVKTLLQGDNNTRFFPFGCQWQTSQITHLQIGTRGWYNCR